MDYDSSNQLISINPATGGHLRTKMTAMEYRAEHPNLTWFFDPWTGSARSAVSISNDPMGFNVVYFPVAFSPVQR